MVIPVPIPTIVITPPECPPYSSTSTPQQPKSGQRASKGSVGMQLTILLAHNGAKLKADSRVVPTIEQLQAWIAQKTSIDVTHQILMTPRGKQVKQQSLNQETEFFLYDRRILSPSDAKNASSLCPETPLPASSALPDAPPNSTEDKGFQEWQALFKDRGAWAQDVVNIAQGAVRKIIALDAEATVVQRGSAIAVENVKQHMGSLRPKYEEAKAWAEDVKYDQQYLCKNWDQNLDKLHHLPVIKELGDCLYRDPNIADRSLKETADGKLTLEDIVDHITTHKASQIVTRVSAQFAERVDNLEDLFEDVAYDAFEVVENFGQSVALSESDIDDQTARLMDEIEVVAKKVNADYEHILTLPETEKSLKDISRTALLHTRNFMPALQQTHDDIAQLLLRTVERKNSVMTTAVQYMQKVATVESMIAQVHSQMAALDIDAADEQAFDTLNFTMKLPSTYGSLLIECVRRREWTDKIMSDSSTLVEEVAIFRDEEAKRRKKWAKDMGIAVNLTSMDDMSLIVDINVKSQKQKWPNVTREHVQTFLSALKKAGVYDELLKEMEALVKGLDVPTRQQTKRAKAFRNGSIQGEQFGGGSLLLHQDGDIVRSLQSEKSRLEERLKTSDSRVKKLEDILHKQKLNSRPLSGDLFTPVPQITTPLSKPHETTSRTSSISSRKAITANDTEEKALAQRIVALESELASVQQQLASKAKTEIELNAQVKDAVSTKEDLLHNMEAQQREFDAERRLIEEENGKLKIKLEEVEDDMDKMLESREQDVRFHRLEQELEKVRKDSALEVEKAQGLVDSMKNDYTISREKANRLERQVHDLDEEVAELSTRLQKRDMSAATNHRALRTVMFRLSKDSVAPEDLDSLVETVEELAKQSQEHLVEVEKALETIRADNTALDASLANRSDEIHDLKQKVGEGDIEIFSLREDTAKHKVDLASLQSELETERHEHDQLRSKFATGETDAESLRKLVAEKETAIADLSGRIAGLEADIEHVEGKAAESGDQLSKLRNTLETKTADHQAQTEQGQAHLAAVQEAHDSLAGNLENRSKQAEELSAHLYDLKNSMGRLLEQVGYTITKQDDTLSFQRASKAASSSTVLPEASSSMTRSVSIPVPSKSFFDTTSPTPTNWLSSSPLSQPVEFANFMSDITSLSPEAFSEAIIRRIKDADHTSRKYIKEARNYRDRYRRTQSETHDKITIRAFKEGDLVLFLPTRNQATGAWAAFNVGYPHYFLREQESHRLSGRDWLLARISKIESRVVDLSKSISNGGGSLQPPTIDPASDDENPFELSDGLRWYLMDAAEEKLGPPMTIGSSKSTVAAANVDAQGRMGANKKKGEADGGEATAKLRGSLDSRRSSSNSKRPGTATSAEQEDEGE
ncbi:MAG: hypothetical protein Q9195_008670, partial [Heterodermia aff. obscurata]